MEGESIRKQKRLGPAPIASFEKSFEDTTTGPSVSGSVSPAVAGTIGAVTSSQSGDHPDDGDKSKKMDSGCESKGNVDKSTVSFKDTNVEENKAQTSQKAGTSSTATSKAPSSSAKKLRDISRRPPPLQPELVNISCTPLGDNVSSAAAIAGTSSVKGAAPTSGATLGLTTPSTPRIDISRASSSSHHEDSRDSSPENVFEQVGTGTLQEAIGLGFREEGALDLRSSTEELFFMDPEQKREEKEKLQQTRKSPIIFKFDDHQTYLQQHQRKDSASSEVAALLCISGRTSRISSVGSQGSAVSRLSAISGVSRSPSPHRMLLETSFCGPKPLENVVDGSIISTVEPPTAEALEQVLLSRKHDPTQAVLAEGIKIETSPKKKSTSNGEHKVCKKHHTTHRTCKHTCLGKPNKPALDTDEIQTITIMNKKGASSAPAARRDSGKQVVGVTPSGTEYIRINLRPDYMYEDKGVAPNERVVEVSGKEKTTKSTSGQKKPVSLSLGREAVTIEQRLTPSLSPKPARHALLSRDIGGGSRSPSPATIAISRKSSFCSLFKAKDSPDSPRDRSRSRSKSRDRSTPQSQTGTPSKQKSVLAIFKPKRSGSKSKCSSPIDHEAISQLDGISQVEFKFKTETPEPRSRSGSRLRYYDPAPDGKGIHIPLHTPPDEKVDRKFPPSEISKEPEPPPPEKIPSEQPPQRDNLPSETILPSNLSHEQVQPQKQAFETIAVIEKAPALPLKSPKLPQIEKVQRIENLDAIHSLPKDINEFERTWSLEVQRHSSQESQEMTISDSGSSTVNSGRKFSKPQLSQLTESPLKENGICPGLPNQTQQQQLQQDNVPGQPISVPPTTNGQQGDPAAREKRRILFATRLGSGSQEQIFSTQFSLSKTESLSSQLSEQTSIPESPATLESKDSLHRSDTVIRRTEDSSVSATIPASTSSATISQKKNDLSSEERAIQDTKPTVVGMIQKKDSSEQLKRKSRSTSEEEDKKPVVVVMRKKESSEDSRGKSKSALEESDGTHRHSRYIENFDPKKKFHESAARKHGTSRNSSDSSIKERDSQTSSKEDPEIPSVPELPSKPHKKNSPAGRTPTRESNLELPQGSSERHSLASTDEHIESSESERDSEVDPNRVRRHISRHIGAIEDHESTGLVSQESFEDDLPYVPTTLPEERARGVSIIPMKERVNMELKTCPVDRPRSTTPMNPASLEEYCGTVTPDDTESPLVRGEKLRISLPRKDSIKDRVQKVKSPRRTSSVTGKSWFEFAEQGIKGSNQQPQPQQQQQQLQSQAQQPLKANSISSTQRRNSKDDEPPPPLPPRKPTGQAASTTGQWINFENIPEKRKPPKRITALPREPHEPLKTMSNPVQYNYVKPEECQCECHEMERESTSTHKTLPDVDLLPHGEDLQPLLEPEPQETIEPSDSSMEYSYGADSLEYRPPLERDSSAQRSRSSGRSQDTDSSDQTISSVREVSKTKKPQDPHRKS